MIYIDRNIFGKETSIVCEDLFDFDIGLSSRRSRWLLDDVDKTFDIDYKQSDILKLHHKVFSNCLSSVYSVLQSVPDHKKRDFLITTKNEIEEYSNKIRNHAYVETYKQQQILFESLQKYHTNNILIEAYLAIEKTESIKNNLKAFKDRRKKGWE